MFRIPDFTRSLSIYPVRLCASRSSAYLMKVHRDRAPHLARCWRGANATRPRSKGDNDERANSVRPIVMAPIRITKLTRNTKSLVVLFVVVNSRGMDVAFRTCGSHKESAREKERVKERHEHKGCFSRTHHTHVNKLCILTIFIHDAD